MNAEIESAKPMDKGITNVMDMSIDFDVEIIEITSKLKQEKGYLDCDRIIIQNIKKQLTEGFDDEKILIYLKKLYGFFDKKIGANQSTADCTNDRYVCGFVETLLKIPYLRSWIKDIDM